MPANPCRLRQRERVDIASEYKCAEDSTSFRVGAYAWHWQRTMLSQNAESGCTACSEEAGDGAAVRRFAGSFADESTTQTPP